MLERKRLILKMSLIIASLLINGLNSFFLPVPVLAQSKVQTPQKLAKDKIPNKAPNNATKLIYSLEMDETRNKDGQVITLAIDAVTIIHCPEPPMQVVVGNESAVAMKETLPTQTDIYISAITPDVVSNLVVEFKNSKSILHFRTTKVQGGPLPGTYTGEVFLKPHKTNSELALARNEVDRLNQEVAKLENSLTQAQKEANEKLALAVTQNSTDMLKLLEQAAFTNKSNNYAVEANIPGHKGHIRITQVSRMIPSSKGNIIIFAIENDSKDTHSLDFIKANNANLTTTFTSKKLTPGFFTYVAVLVDTASISNFDKEILFVVDSLPVKVRVSTFLNAV